MDLLQAELAALLQVIVIDVVLAGDNAIVVGLAASRVAPSLRARVIFWGIAGAVVLRILFALVTVQLLAIVGLTLAGGILLLWVCWKMYREITHEPKAASAGAAVVSQRRRADRRHDGLLGRADPDHHRRRVHVARQRAGGGRRRQGPYLGAGGRPGRRRRADGGGRDLYRQAAGAVSPGSPGSACW